jgi:hypothetical protein
MFLCSNLCNEANEKGEVIIYQNGRSTLHKNLNKYEKSELMNILGNV